MKVTKLIAAHNDSGGPFVKHMAEWGVLAGELQEILEDLKRLSSWDNDKARESLNCAALHLLGKNVAIFFYEIFWNGNDPPKLAFLILKILQRNFLDRK